MADLILLKNATKRFLTRINIGAVLDTKWAHTKNTHFSQEGPCRHLSLRILHKDLNSIAFFIHAGEQTATVVFDGYGSEPSTKSMTHQRRSAGKGSATVTLQDGMKVTAKRDAFLANTEKKKRFIAMLQRYLSESGCRTLQAEGDADVLIVKTAVDSAVTHPTVLVGDDTDLLVLLCYHTKADGNDLYFRPEPKANSSFREIRVWNILKVKAEFGQAVCCFCMPFLVVIRLALTVLENPRPLKNCESVYFQDQAKVNFFFSVFFCWWQEMKKT